jgi:hypothetical protein
MSAKRENERGAGLSPLTKKGKGDDGDIEVDEDFDDTHGLAPPPPPPLIPVGETGGLTPQQGTSAVPASGQAESPPLWATSSKDDILQGVKSTIETTVQTMTNDVNKLKETVFVIESKADEAIKIARGAKEATDGLQTVIETTVNETINKRITDIEIKLAQHAKHKVGESSDQILCGGFEDMTFTNAEDWLTRKFKELNISNAQEIYHKGDEFKGLVFARFHSQEAAQTATDKIGNNKYKVGTNNIWSKKDLPLETRVPVSFLLGLRWQLAEWKSLPKSQIKVDDENFTMKIGRVPVMSATVIDNKLQIRWLDPAWENWEELQKSQELASLISVANGKLTAAADGHAKGKGKGDGPQ